MWFQCFQYALVHLTLAASVRMIWRSVAAVLFVKPRLAFRREIMIFSISCEGFATVHGGRMSTATATLLLGAQASEHHRCLTLSNWVGSRTQVFGWEADDVEPHRR